MSLDDREAGDLLELLDNGEVTLRLLGSPASPYVYDLLMAEDGHIPADLEYIIRPDDDDVATVHNTFHSDIPDNTVVERRYRWHVYPVDQQADVVIAGLPHKRTDYLVGGPDTEERRGGDPRFEQWVSAGSWQTPTGEIGGGRGRMVTGLISYDGGEQLERTWFRQPTRPGVAERTRQLAHLPPVIRHDDTLLVWDTLRPWVDDHGNSGYGDGIHDTVDFRFYEDGELVAEQNWVPGSFPVSTGAAEHRLELDVTRGVAREAPWWKTSTETQTAWTLQTPSWPPADGLHDPCPELEDEFSSCTMRPLLDLELDLLNTALLPQDRRGQPTIELHARHAGALLGEELDGPAIAGVRLWTSYDDGATWRERPGDDRGDGRYLFRLDDRDPDETNGFVALRVEAWDVEGNRIEQEITRAYQLPPRD